MAPPSSFAVDRMVSTRPFITTSCEAIFSPSSREISSALAMNLLAKKPVTNTHISVTSPSIYDVLRISTVNPVAVGPYITK